MKNNVRLRPLQLTYREIIAQMSDYRTLLWLAAAIIALVAAGPFGTLERLNFLERFAYWTLTAPATFLLGNFTATISAMWFQSKGFHKWGSYVIAGILASFPVSIFVWLLESLINTEAPFDFGFLIQLLTLITPVTLPVTLIFGIYETKTQHKEEQPADRFFRRMPKHLGRDLISLQADDHYIRVVTSKGSDLLLMRLVDAISELQAYDGFQTHRSWWVAAKHIQSTETQNGRRWAILSNNEKVPISRTYWKKIAEQLPYNPR